VTRLLEALTLEPLTVDVLDQRMTEAGDLGAVWLDLSSAAASVVRRRVSIAGRTFGRLHSVAESLLVPSRLPEAFIGALMGSPKALGEALGDLRLETRRELLWFGAARTPSWAEPVVEHQLLLTRSYRIIVAGRPSILIAENFPLVER
jgi:chorismate-pyruvate lyase